MANNHITIVQETRKKSRSFQAVVIYTAFCAKVDAESRARLALDDCTPVISHERNNVTSAAKHKSNMPDPHIQKSHCSFIARWHLDGGNTWSAGGTHGRNQPTTAITASSLHSHNVNKQINR